MRRRSEESRREDAAETRARLVEAGVRVFARNPYDDASVREIAAEASVTVAMVGYHFNGKEGLYRAVADRIVQAGLERVGPAMGAAQKVLAQPSPDRNLIVGEITRMLRDLLQTTRDDDTFDWARIMLREQLDPSPAGEVMHEGLVSPYIGVLALLIARVGGRDAAQRTDLVRAFALMGQMIVFRSARHGADRLLGGHVLLDDDISSLMAFVEQQLTLTPVD